ASIVSLASPKMPASSPVMSGRSWSVSIDTVANASARWTVNVGWAKVGPPSTDAAASVSHLAVIAPAVTARQLLPPEIVSTRHAERYGLMAVHAPTWMIVGSKT